jgi:transposase
MIIDMADEFFPDNHASKAKHQSAGIRQILQRAEMLALAHGQVNLGTIAWFTNRHVTTVRKWIMRSKNGDELCDQKRSGRPPVYNEKTQLKTIAFYCQVSPLPGSNSWSLRWAENYLKKHSEITHNI